MNNTYPVKRSDRRAIKAGDRVTFAVTIPGEAPRIITDVPVKKVTRHYLVVENERYGTENGWHWALVSALVTQ